MKDNIYFMVRHIPFWASPLGLIFAEFAYIYFKKGHKQASKLFAGIALMNFLAILFYVIAGGPEKAVQILIYYFGY